MIELVVAGETNCNLSGGKLNAISMALTFCPSVLSKTVISKLSPTLYIPNGGLTTNFAATENEVPKSHQLAITAKPAPATSSSVQRLLDLLTLTFNISQLRN